MNVWFLILVEEEDEGVVFYFGGRGRRQVDVVMWYWMRKKNMKVWFSNLVEGEEGMEM